MKYLVLVAILARAFNRFIIIIFYLILYYFALRFSSPNLALKVVSKYCHKPVSEALDAQTPSWVTLKRV